MRLEIVFVVLADQAKLGPVVVASRDGDGLLCRLRASDSRLRDEAAAINYKMKFRGEIDPGSEFWSRKELKKDMEDLEQGQALSELENMFKDGQIQPEEVQIFEPNENKELWSRRVHALDRIAKRVPVTNDTPAYTEYVSAPHVQHIFARYSDGRHDSLFRTVDRLKLTKSILESYVDTGRLKECGIIKECMALHDASRSSSWDRGKLLKCWVHPFCGVAASDIGQITMSADTEQGETHNGVWRRRAMPFYKRPFVQPLQRVADYFGEKIGLYFCFLGYYTYGLVIPAVVGLVSFILTYSDSPTHTGFDYQDEFTVVYCFLVMMWTVIFAKFWKQENRIVVLKWGMVNFEEDAPERPQFHGRMRLSVANNQMERHYPAWRRRAATIMAYSVIFFAIVVLCAILEELFIIRHLLVDEQKYSWGKTFFAFSVAVMIQILGGIFEKIAGTLNDWENHRTEIDYDDNLIFKMFVFEMFNSYGVLYYTAFAKQYTYGCDDKDCMGELRILMICIFIVRMMMNVVEIGFPLFTIALKNKLESHAMAQGKKTDNGSVNPIFLQVQGSSSMAGDDADSESLMADKVPAFEEEAPLFEYDDTFSDYAEMTIQYGFVVLFTAAFPLAPLCALIENIIEIRVDAFKLCSLTQRPDAKGAEDIGTWGTFLNLFGILGILTNAALIAFTTNDLAEYTMPTRVLVFVVVEHVLLGCKYALEYAIDDVPGWVDDQIKRNSFIEAKHIFGVDDEVEEDTSRNTTAAEFISTGTMIQQ